MGKLEELKSCELFETNGGVSSVVTTINTLELAGVIVAGYLGLREVFRDAGRAAAYNDLREAISAQ